VEQLDATRARGPSVSGRFHYPPSTFPSPVGIGRPTTCHQVYRPLLAVTPRDSFTIAQERRRRFLPRTEVRGIRAEDLMNADLQAANLAQIPAQLAWSAAQHGVGVPAQ
jgi:hypothetical protein